MNPHKKNLPAESTSNTGSASFASFVERLRRRTVGLVHVPLLHMEAALHGIEQDLCSAERADVLSSLSANDLEHLTAERLHERVVPRAARKTQQPRVVLHFEALFYALDESSQDRVKRALARAEPLAPCVLLLHSPLTISRLSDRFEGRIYHWPAA